MAVPVSVSRFFGPRYIGDKFFLGPNLVSFNRTVVPYEISKVNFRVERKILVSMPLACIKMPPRHCVYKCFWILLQNQNIFFIPKIIVVNDLLKLSLNSYAAKDTICVLFLTTGDPCLCFDCFLKNNLLC
jgi:hypothetical protein